MRLFGLIGYPLTHSFSKSYFTRKFKEEGLPDCRFENFSIPSLDELPSVLKNNPSLEGLAVTIPYKKLVLDYLDANFIPAGLDACNCIRVADHHLTGYNTDLIGFEKSLAPLLQSHHQKALVLGNGGATASVIFVLKKLGIGYTIVSRTLHHESTMVYEELDENIMAEHKLIINTTPLGTFPAVEEYPAILYSALSSAHLLYDLVYNPAKTLFLQKGEQKGASIKNGREMLEIQAEENWKIWNGE